MVLKSLELHTLNPRNNTAWSCHSSQVSLSRQVWVLSEGWQLYDLIHLCCEVIKKEGSVGNSQIWKWYYSGILRYIPAWWSACKCMSWHICGWMEMNSVPWICSVKLSDDGLNDLFKDILINLSPFLSHHYHLRSRRELNSSRVFHTYSKLAGARVSVFDPGHEPPGGKSLLKARRAKFMITFPPWGCAEVLLLLRLFSPPLLVSWTCHAKWMTWY